MRLLVSSTSGHGHVLPMVPLARAIQAAVARGVRRVLERVAAGD